MPKRESPLEGEMLQGTGDRGWIASKYHRLTAAGRKQLSTQAARWEQAVRATGRILKPATQ